MVNGKELGEKAGAIIVKAIEAYGLLLAVILVLILVAAYANTGLDIIKHALEVALSFIP